MEYTLVIILGQYSAYDKVGGICLQYSLSLWVEMVQYRCRYYSLFETLKCLYIGLVPHERSVFLGEVY